jgi:hypothetical protein
MTDVKTQTHQVVIGTAHGLRLPAGDAPPSFADASITSVHADGQSLWLLVDRQHLHRVVGPMTDHVASLDEPSGGCVLTHRDNVWIGGRRARLWRLDGSTLAEVESFQHAPTHDEWHTPWGGPPDIFSMASDGTHLYVSVHVGGILRTLDGTSWTPTIDLHDDVHQVAVGADGTVWAATGMRGLAQSDDQGATWRAHTNGLHARYALAVAAVKNGALIAVSSGHAARDGVVHHFDGERFIRCAGLPSDLRGAVGPRQLASAGDQAVVALPNGDVYASQNGGREWSFFAQGLGSVSEIALRSVSSNVS